MPVSVSQPIETQPACPSDNADCSLVSSSIPTPSSPEVASPEPSSCPPPLGWKSVLNQVRDESRGWEIDGRCGRVCGRTLGDGPPLYLLNGVGGTWELFALAMYLLRDEFRCVIVEYPGVRSPFSLDDFTADLFQIADEHGDERFSLFATSYGAVPAFAVMSSQPERIDRAVINAGFAHRRLSLMERLLVGIGKRLRISLGRTPFFRRVLEHNHLTWFPPFDKSRWQFLLDNTGSVAVRTLCRRIAAFQKRDASSSLSEITQPVHLLETEGEGVAVAKERERLQNLIPHATTESLPHCGLLPFLTHPHLLAKSLKTYLACGEG